MTQRAVRPPRSRHARRRRLPTPIGAHGTDFGPAVAPAPPPPIAGRATPVAIDLRR